MPPNAEKREGGVEETPDSGSATPDMEAAEQKAEVEAEVTPHSVFRENKHHTAEEQKIITNAETTMATSGTTETEGKFFHSLQLKKELNSFENTKAK